MAMHEAHVTGHHAHDENIDHQGNANLAIWLGLVALTFTTATFVGTNVYLRGWNPSKFDTLHAKLLIDLPYYDVLLLILGAILLFIGGGLFVKNRWSALRGVLALTTLVFVAVMVVQFRLTLWFAWSSPQIATIYAPTSAIEFLLSLVCVIMFAVAGWYASFGNKAKINAFFPVAMNVWLYTVVSAVVILLVENVMTVGQFAAWCGQHLS
ncbi:MAG: hypothetical protein K6T83_11590 [Alicyclobacillus sp.]|nr:hypothetical protein [Alicyclobacillus sp.]